MKNERSLPVQLLCWHAKHQSGCYYTFTITRIFFRTTIYMYIGMAKRKMRKGGAMDAAVAKLPSEAFHVAGVLIIAPQGAGKTTYCRYNKQWVDSDALMLEAKLMKRQEKAPAATLKTWEAQNRALKKRGLWVLSSAWWSLKDADAVVLPTRATLASRLSKKTGAERIRDPVFEADNQLRLLREWAAKAGKPAFASIADACCMVP